MFRVINDYMSKININTDDEMYSVMKDYLDESELIKRYSINVNFNRYIVDIKLHKYSVEASDQMFREFVSITAYPYSHISVRYNEGSRVTYRYVTCKENKSGVYMDIIISEDKK